MSVRKKDLSDDYGRLSMAAPAKGGGKNGRGAARHYNLMPLEQIKKMPVADFADPNGSHCWLWCTAASLRDGYDVLESWGFVPRSIFCWIKAGRLGLGVYLRNCVEMILLGTRGKAPVLYKGQPNWGFFPVQDHSHKPEEQYAIMERVSPGPNRLELFARRRQPGWDCWGNEIDSDIEISGFPVPLVRGVKQDIPKEEVK